MAIWSVVSHGADMFISFFISTTSSAVDGDENDGSGRQPTLTCRRRRPPTDVDDNDNVDDDNTVCVNYF